MDKIFIIENTLTYNDFEIDLKSPDNCIENYLLQGDFCLMEKNNKKIYHKYVFFLDKKVNLAFCIFEEKLSYIRVVFADCNSNYKLFLNKVLGVVETEFKLDFIKKDVFNYYYEDNYFLIKIIGDSRLCSVTWIIYYS